MSEWSKEPWTRVPWGIDGSDGKPVLTFLHLSVPQERRDFRRPAREQSANAERTAACVSACAGIADPPAALAEVRSALEKAASMLLSISSHDDTPAALLSDECRRALALLGEAPRG